MKICLLLLLIPFLAFVLKTTAGTCFSCCNSSERRAIEEAVDNIKLSEILVLHLRSKSADFANLGLQGKNLSYFRQCVKRKYLANKQKIDAMAQNSNDKFRRMSLGAKAHAIQIKRQERKRASVEG